MLQNEQQQFSIVARGVGTAMFILFIVGFILLVPTIYFSFRYFYIHWLPAVIVFPASLCFMALFFGGAYGRRVTINVDIAESTFTIHVEEGLIRKCMPCCCQTGIRGASKFNFTDAVTIHLEALWCTRSAIEILFLNGCFFNSNVSFKNRDSRRFCQVVNGYNNQRFPQPVSNSQPIQGNQYVGNPRAVHPLTTEDPQQPVYAVQSEYPVQPVYPTQPQMAQRNAPPPGANPQPARPPAQLPPQKVHPTEVRPIRRQ
ncbi:hypothetical protein BLNAU_10123 [Blattamonas nauphoetae]|uniref:Uncharacterized protein n=1 Tax=Blattamonas nauphoetae TaxID=2049346 RepID=A0ABQ9XU29_9EUKA|nr:hypothetical protein BLNAU_10123 [Blattamonas nauphoetae]